MKKLVLFLSFITLFSLTACGQRPDGNIVGEIHVTKIIFPDGSFLTTATGLGTGTVVSDWNTMANKPTSFTPAIHTHNYVDLLGKPSLFSGNYADLAGKPVDKDLSDALVLLKLWRSTGLTTAEISALTLTPSEFVEVWDKTLGVKKAWVNGVWKTYITDK